MANQDFTLSILQKTRVFKEREREVESSSVSEYMLRLKNEQELPCIVDLYIEEKKVNEIGQIVVFGNDYVDFPGFLKKEGIKKFEFSDLQDKEVEAKIYLEKEKTIIKPEGDYTIRPIYLYSVNQDCIYPIFPELMGIEWDITRSSALEKQSKDSLCFNYKCFNYK